MEFDPKLDLNIFIRLLVAIALAGILGWERERIGKAAGIRTHILVGMGAALFVILGELFVLRFRELDDNMRFDPLRIIQAVVTGISFLGAGMIFVAHRNRHEQEHVRGLTTAASIWVTAAVGMLVGLERYLLAVAASVLTFFVLHIGVVTKPSGGNEDEGGQVGRRKTDRKTGRGAGRGMPPGASSFQCRFPSDAGLTLFLLKQNSPIMI